MNNKNRLELLINSIQRANPKIRIEDISTGAGYKPQTLTQSLSSGKISDRMYNSVLNEWGDKASPGDGFAGKTKALPSVLIGRHEAASFEAIIRSESLIRVNASYIAEIYGHLMKVPATKVLRDMELMADSESAKKLDQLKGR